MYINPNEDIQLYQTVLDTALMQNEAAHKANSPSYILRPRLFVNGNKWCALLGENLQDGVVGFGDSPELAFVDFDRAWCEKLPQALKEGGEQA